MCLIIFLYDKHPDYRLILAANRDEFYDRPTSPLAFWDDTPAVLAGRDLKGKGTWLGIAKNGRIAAITNFREPALFKPNAPSRGLLLLYYYSNKMDKIKKLKPGLYGLSNHLLDTPWPKVEKGKAFFKNVFSKEKQINTDDIFNLLADRTFVPDDRLPDTGIGLKWEQILSPLFITSDTYGTRSSSIVLIDKSHKVIFSERSFTPEETGSFKQKTRRFNFQIS